MLESCNILIADDEALMINLLSSMLKDLHVKNIFIANNGEQAVKLFKENQVDITFLDIDMPIMDGLDTLQSIKKMSKDAVVIMLSGSNTEANVQDAILLGATSFIAKPYNLKKVLSTLKKCLPKSK